MSVNADKKTLMLSKFSFNQLLCEERFSASITTHTGVELYW